MPKRPTVYLYREKNDHMKDVVVCPNCGGTSTYGELINNTGHHACAHCYPTLAKYIQDIRTHDYERYRTADHLYLLSDEEYYEACVTHVRKQLSSLRASIQKLKAR